MERQTRPASRELSLMAEAGVTLPRSTAYSYTEAGAPGGG